MSKRYRMAIVSRVPFVKRNPIKYQRTPVKRQAIFSREPVYFKEIGYEGCSLCNKLQVNCISQTEYCEWNTKPEKSNFQVFRLITISHELSECETQELIEKINHVKENGCYIRLIAEVPLTKEVLFALGYEPLNVIQFNLNLLEEDEDFLRKMKQTIFTADNCGLYVGLMLYPVIPGVTKCHNILELLNSLRNSCDIVCFRYLDLPSSCKIYDNTYFNINGYAVPCKYFIRLNNMWVVNSYYRRTFSTAILRFLSPRKVNCLCCNEHICY